MHVSESFINDNLQKAPKTELRMKRNKKNYMYHASDLSNSALHMTFSVNFP